MKRIFALMLTITLLLTACTTSGESTSSAVKSSEPEIELDLSLDVDLFSEGEELSGTLVISSDVVSEQGDGYYGVLPLVEGFKELHPNVEVVVEGTFTSDGSKSAEENAVALEQYKNDVRVSIASDNAPDLLFTFDDYASNFIPSGNIMNLNAFIENDSSFKKEDFFMQVLEASEIMGGLYVMPNTIWFNTFRMKEDVLIEAGLDPSTIESVDYKLLLDIYNKAISSGKFPELKSIGIDGAEGQAILEKYAIISAFNNKNMAANFDSPEFIEYLNLTKSYTGYNKEMQADYGPFGSFWGPGQNDVPMFFPNDHFVERGSRYMIFFDTAQFIVGNENGITNPIPVTTTNDELGIEHGYKMSIPTNAKKPELAWEFIKYCTYESEEVGSMMDMETFGKWNGNRFRMHIPINKNNFVNYVNVELVNYTEEERNEMISFYEKCLSFPLRTMNTDIFLPVFEGDIWSDFYMKDGMYTAEEVANIIQEKVDIYLAEIG